MRIYLDPSCIDRPFDDQRQPRIRLEAEAVTLILEKVDSGIWQYVGSDMVRIELEATSDPERLRRLRTLMPDPQDRIPLDEAIFHRAAECEKMGFKPADAVHIAAAETLSVDVLLSCDDRMCRAAKRNRTKLRVLVANPLDWLKEHGHDANA